MDLDKVSEVLAMGPPPPGTQPNSQGETIKLIGMFALMGLIFYFLLIRPQRQKQKQLDTLLKSMKPGDKILTSSGIIGVVLTVKDKSVSIRSADTKLEILKTAVSEVTERAGEPSES